MENCYAAQQYKICAGNDNAIAAMNVDQQRGFSMTK